MSKQLILSWVVAGSAVTVAVVFGFMALSTTPEHNRVKILELETLVSTNNEILEHNQDILSRNEETLRRNEITMKLVLDLIDKKNENRD